MIIIIIILTHIHFTLRYSRIMVDADPNGYISVKKFVCAEKERTCFFITLIFSSLSVFLSFFLSFFRSFFRFPFSCLSILLICFSPRSLSRITMMPLESVTSVLVQWNLLKICDDLDAEELTFEADPADVDAPTMFERGFVSVNTLTVDSFEVGLYICVCVCDVHLFK